MLGAVREATGTPALDSRHELLQGLSKDYLSGVDDEPPRLTIEEIRVLEEQRALDSNARPQVKCDGCGLEQDARVGRDGEPEKPSYWYSREDEDGVQLACSRECISVIAEKTGKSSMVMPW